MARKGYRSKLKLKSRQKRASVDEADGTIIECAVCYKKIVIVSVISPSLQLRLDCADDSGRQAPETTYSLGWCRDARM
jgi:hypothetical protein